MSQDPYKYFRVEASELLEQIGKGVLELEKDPLPADLVPKLLRLAHTLKGAARVVKQVEIAELAHAMEDTLAALRERKSALTHEPATALLQKVDAIGARVSALALPAGTSPARGEPPPAAGASDEALRALRCDVGDMEALLQGIAEMSTHALGLRRSLETVERARHLAGLLVEESARPRRAAAALPERGAKRASVAAEVRAAVGALGRELTTGLDELERELRRTREACERLRLVPASAVFVPLERAARDAALAAGKRVRFEGRGGEVRLDADVLARVQPALIQLVRNAIAHGVEPDAERAAAGKPAEGSVVLEVARRGARIVFRCRDDGRGLDLDAVRKSAARKGHSARELERLGVEELVRLLLRGGISTSGAVTEVSGRGVGLDVVRAAAQALGGDVVVETAPRAGTTVDLVVPTTLASLEALVVDDEGTSAAIPMDAVRGVMHLARDTVVGGAEGALVAHRGELIRLEPLAGLLAGRTRSANTSSAANTGSAVVVDGGDGLAAIGVERVRGVQSALVRALPPLAPVEPVVTGLYLDELGNPRPVLDAGELVAAARRASPRAIRGEERLPPILVIDDSLTTRMLEQSILETAGYEVDLACSAEEGLEKARHRRYGAILVDVEMPGMNGFEFVERTRADAELRAVPAVLVTSRNAPEDRRRGASAGAAAYVVKSDFDQRALLDTLQRLLRR